MPVDQPRDHRPAAGVDLGRGGVGQRRDLGVAADRRDAAVPDRDRLVDGGGRVQRDDLGAADHQVGPGVAGRRPRHRHAPSA